MKMTPDWVKVIIDVLQIAWMIGLSGYWFFTRRHMANKTAIEDLDERTDQRFEAMGKINDDRYNKLSDRVLTTESAIKHMPSQQELGSIHDKINKVTEDVSEMRGELKPIAHSLQNIQNYLMQGGNKR